MATEILKSFDALQEELETARNDLKGVDDHLKKLIGRDPSDGGPQPRPGLKRPVNQSEEFRGRGRAYAPSRGPWDPRGRQEEDGQPTVKRRLGDPRTVFSRLSGPPQAKRDADSGDEDELPNKPLISSRVFATPREVPSRQEAMAAQNKDERSKARNRRMFGALIGTLQKFRQEETRMKDKEEKRAIVEKKLEENAKREKEELKRERVVLFQERKQKQAEIRKIELKMLRIREQDEWETQHRRLLNFIQTRSKPHIFYLPKVHNMKTEERLVASQKIVAKMIEKKRADVQAELEAIEKRGRWRQGLRDGAPLGQTVSDDERGEQDEQRGVVLDKENRIDSNIGDSVGESEDKIADSGKVEVVGVKVEVKEEEEVDLEGTGIILGEVDENESGILDTDGDVTMTVVETFRGTKELETSTDQKKGESKDEIIVESIGLDESKDEGKDETKDESRDESRESSPKSI